MTKKTGSLKKYLIIAAICWLAAIIILLILNSIKAGELPVLETVLSVSVVLLVAGPLLGGLLHLQVRAGQKSKRIVLDRSPFIEFLANGFDAKDNKVVGIVRGYTVIINYEWQPRPNIEVKVLFDPKLHGIDRTQAELEQIYNTKRQRMWKERTLFWLPYFMMCKMPVVFKKLPDYEKVNERINFIIDIFQKGDLKPAGFEFYEKHYPAELDD